MPRIFTCQTECYGFRSRRWKPGERVALGDEEIKNLPRDKDGNIVHFVAPADFVPPPPKRGQPISPLANPDQLQRKSVIAGPVVSPGTAPEEHSPEPAGHVQTPTSPAPNKDYIPEARTVGGKRKK